MTQKNLQSKFKVFLRPFAYSLLLKFLFVC